MTVYCECGCGQVAPLSDRNRPDRNVVKGQQLRFIQGHSAKFARRRERDYEVRACGYDTPCWVWLGALSHGYGTWDRMRDGVKGRTHAHRVYYEQARGPIPDGLQIDHLCRNRACVNPDHLEPVTNAVNSQRGAQAKLTPAAVREIRRSRRTTRDLAQRFGINHGGVSRIKRGQMWGNVEEVCPRCENLRFDGGGEPCQVCA